MHRNFIARQMSGFTLIELMVAVAILGILIAIGYPSYTDYVRSGYISNATSELSELALNMEQNYQENRSYQSTVAANAGECAITKANSKYFSFACTTTSKTTFKWTAASLANVGLGAANSYQYTIDQNSAKQTTSYDGSVLTTALDEWKK